MSENVHCVCGAVTDEGDHDWVACDDCDVWFHAQCVGIVTPAAFEMLKTRPYN